MTESQQTLLMIKGMVAELDSERIAECKKLEREIKMLLDSADPFVATLVIALIGIEAQLQSER